MGRRPRKHTQRHLSTTGEPPRRGVRDVHPRQSAKRTDYALMIVVLVLPAFAARLVGRALFGHFATSFAAGYVAGLVWMLGMASCSALLYVIANRASSERWHEVGPLLGFVFAFAAIAPFPGRASRGKALQIFDASYPGVGAAFLTVIVTALVIRVLCWIGGRILDDFRESG